MTGYVTGTLTGGANDLLESAARSLAVAARLDCPRLNLHGTGLDPNGLPVTPVHETTGAMWLAAVRTLNRIAELGERAGRVFTLENLNTAVDHPGVPFARAADTLALVRRAGPAIGEIQVADVPGRREPGTGEINYPAITTAPEGIGYTGVVGLEGWASGDPEQALDRFRRAFSVAGEGL